MTQEKKPELDQLIRRSARELGAALPAHMTPERMVRIALTCIRLNPKLLTCTPESFLGALFTLAQIGLEPMAGRAYLIPFANNKKVGNEWKTFNEVQVVIGYQGMIDLFYRNEMSLSIQAQTVYANDFFEYQFGTDSKLIHKPVKKDRGDKVAYYAIAKMKDGGSLFEVMSLEEMERHAKHYSKQFNKKDNKWGDKAVWVNEFDEMAKKTVIKRLSKVLPISIELRRAISVDESSREYKSGVTKMLDLPDTSYEEVIDVEEENKHSKGEDLSKQEIDKAKAEVVNEASARICQRLGYKAEAAREIISNYCKGEFKIDLKKYSQITVEQAQKIADYLDTYEAQK